MKIGILSDTHSKIKKAINTLDFLISQGAEVIVHAGDICEYETLELLKNCGKKYVVVYGNNDAHLAKYHNKYNLVQEPYYFNLANTNFKLMHLPFYMAPDSEIVISGHTHDFKVEFINGTLFINPGESCARNKPLSECALLEVSDDNLYVIYYTKKKKQENFVIEKEFSYKRKKS